MLVVSLMARSNIYAIVLMRDGQLVSKDVGHIDTTNIYKALLDTFSRSLLSVRNYLENNTDCDRVIFELNHETVIKWINHSSCAKPEYVDQLETLNDRIQEIPMIYEFAHAEKPVASMYCKQQYIKSKLKLSGLM